VKTGIARPLRAAIGLAVLFTILFIVNGYVREYRSLERSQTGASAAGSSSPTSATAEGGEEGTPAAEGEAASPADTPEEKPAVYVIVRIDGLNLRVKPDKASESQKGLSKGDRLVLLSEVDGWYEVRTESGEQGWVSSSSTYTSIEGR